MLSIKLSCGLDLQAGPCLSQPSSEFCCPYSTAASEKPSMQCFCPRPARSALLSSVCRVSPLRDCCSLCTISSHSSANLYAFLRHHVLGVLGEEEPGLLHKFLHCKIHSRFLTILLCRLHDRTGIRTGRRRWAHGGRQRRVFAHKCSNARKPRRWNVSKAFRWPIVCKSCFMIAACLELLKLERERIHRR